MKRTHPESEYSGVLPEGSNYTAVASVFPGASVRLGYFKDQRTAALAIEAARKVPRYRALGAVQALLLKMWPTKTWIMSDKEQIRVGLKGSGASHSGGSGGSGGGGVGGGGGGSSDSGSGSGSGGSGAGGRIPAKTLSAYRIRQLVEEQNSDSAAAAKLARVKAGSMSRAARMAKRKKEERGEEEEEEGEKGGKHEV